MQTIIITIAAILLGSALFSCSEAALFTISLGRAKALGEQKKRGALNLIKIKENMRRPITVLVVLNNIFNIVGSIIIGALTSKVFGSAWIGVISAVFTLLIILFGEILPKSFGENYAERIALRIAGPLLALTKLFIPLVWCIERATQPFLKKNQIISEEEIRILSHLGHLEGSIEKDEQEIIQRVFLLNDLTAKDIMTPRTVMETLEADKTLGAVEATIYTLSHSRLPVYAQNRDNIVGICHQRQLLTAIGRDEKNRKVAEFMQAPIFVPEKMRVDELLLFFQNKKCHLAVVKDEFGGTMGIVTLEDALEQLVGEIVDEKDREVDMRATAKEKAQSIGVAGGP